MRIQRKIVAKQAGDRFPRDTDDYPALVLLASRMEPELRRQFLAAIREARRELVLEQLEEAVRNGTAVQDVKRVLGQLDTTLAQRIQPTMLAGYLRGAEFAVDRMAQVQISVSLEMVNPHAVAWASSHTPQLADDLVKGGAENIQRLIQEAVEDGIPPKATARRIRDHIGLTAPDSRTLRRFIRSLRDEGVSPSRIEMRASRMAMSMIRRRAETIARTETMRALNMGQLGSWKEAQARRLIPTDARRRYVVTWDEVLCPFCERLAGSTALIDGTVWSIEGEVVMTGFTGPVAHPNCRCTTVLVL